MAGKFIRHHGVITTLPSPGHLVTSGLRLKPEITRSLCQHPGGRWTLAASQLTGREGLAGAGREFTGGEGDLGRRGLMLSHRAGKGLGDPHRGSEHVTPKCAFMVCGLF